METIGYAIVGTGYFGAELARILSSLPGAAIRVVHDPENAEAVARELGCEVAQDLTSLLSREDVDAVIVASPNGNHHEAVMEAARHGKHIFCEKPIALSYKDCNEMVNAAAEAGVTFMAGHIMNFFNGVRLAKKFIAEGRIGDVLYCHSARNGWEEMQESVSWKKIRDISGGHLYHHIHELDCIQFLMGPAETVTMTGGNVAHQGAGYGDEDDMLFLTLEFGGDRFAICEYGSAFHWPEHYLLIQGSKGAIKLDMTNAGVTLRSPEGVERHLLHRSSEEDAERTRIYAGTMMDGAIMYGSPGVKPPLWLQGIMIEEMTFFNALMHGEQVGPEFTPLLTGQAARDSIATADAATLSLRENRKVRVSEIKEAHRDWVWTP
ncbi:MAG: Gfo/Idh/MocA family oxidoreductase [Propionibacteriaceae bacterium]|nr:Gfo/Idh/MocA family oxidoreductase [Propionibacteriaceae bacterium]